MSAITNRTILLLYIGPCSYSLLYSLFNVFHPVHSVRTDLQCSMLDACYYYLKFLFLLLKLGIYTPLYHFNFRIQIYLVIYLKQMFGYNSQDAAAYGAQQYQATYSSNPVAYTQQTQQQQDGGSSVAALQNLGAAASAYAFVF